MSEMVDRLERARVMAGLSEASRAVLSRLEIVPVLDSTNRYLLAGAHAGWPGGAVCLAEQQTAGRGRQGRRWLTPFGASLALSLLWRFDRPPEALSGLSLVTGIAVARALQKQRISDVGLKWPNDLWWRERKLGGILLESGGGGERFHVVAGIGVNVALPPQEGQQIDQPWVDLREITGQAVLDRSRWAAGLVDEVIRAFIRFQAEGFSGFIGEWNRFDRVRGRRVRLLLPNGAVSGLARGVDETGALLLEGADGKLAPYLGGEISLRLEA